MGLEKMMRTRTCEVKGIRGKFTDANVQAHSVVFREQGTIYCVLDFIP